MNREEFKERYSSGKIAGKQIVLPVHKRLSADLVTPVMAYLCLRDPSRYSFLLESVEGGERLARYSFIGIRPRLVVRADVNATVIEEYDADGDIVSSSEHDDHIFGVLQDVLDGYHEIEVPDLPRLTGGAVGFISYDAVRHLERLDEPPPDDLHLPNAIWGFYRSVLAFDHVRRQIVLISNAIVNGDADLDRAFDIAVRDIERLEERLSLPQREYTVPEKIVVGTNEATANMSRTDFEDSVAAARNHIYEGDVLQVVLSQRFEMGFSGDPFNLYRALRQVNPSPYLYYLDFIDFSLVGSSPEVLVRVEGGKAELLPIAGTRPRGATQERDRELEEDLLADAKEIAEHTMLVDLGRNDLGRICRNGSVSVERYAYIERYSHVMHIVSSVSGELAAGKKPMDVLAACFPAGTVSGAPKVAAMKLIDRLEPSRRGVYAGTVGYVDFSGNMDTCIAIRTMLVRNNTVYMQAGAGIVADSVPAREFEETVNKASALQRAIHVAAEELL